MQSKSDKPILKPQVEMALVAEIALQAKLAEMAGNCLSNASNSVEYWSAIQSILSASANVSKILWPVKERKARGDYLRNLLGVDKDHLLSDRSIRNSYEHYDERIEDWFEKHDTAAYLDLALEAHLPSSLMPPMFAHRSYDQYTFELKFRDEKINLRELLSELAKLREKCRPFALVVD
jgi:hypothetical protein